MSVRRHPIAAIAGVTIVVVAFMAVSGMGPNVVAVAALCGLVGVGLWFLVDLATEAVGATGTGARRVPPPPVRADRRVMHLRSGLATGRPDRPALLQLRTALVELVDDQLRAVHHVDLAEDPDSARAVIGDELYDFVVDEDSAGMLSSPRTVDHIVTLIERI